MAMTADVLPPRRMAARKPRGGVQPAVDGAPSRRQTRKEATRNRVIAAARELFDTQGYQGATIRDIARHAGVSVGSVFTTFASKGEILSQVMEERLESFYAELDCVVPHLRGSTADRLRSMFAIFFAFEARRTKLFLSHIAATYDWTLSSAARPYGHNQRVVAMIRDCLAKGVDQGDVSPSADLDDLVNLLIGAFAWTFRLAATEGADGEGLTRVMDRQIGLIAEGFRPRS